VVIFPIFIQNVFYNKLSNYINFFSIIFGFSGFCPDINFKRLKIK